MKKSNLLKEAIADAKAVRETAIANAKVALEEVFTPRLQSILSQKLQQEMEDEEEVDLEEEYDASDAPTGDSSSIGAGASANSGTTGKQPSGITTDAHTKLDPETTKISDKVGTEDDNVDVVSESEFDDDENGDGVLDDPTGATVTEDDDFDADDMGGESDEFGGEPEEDDLDLESIIRELEAEFGDEESSDEFGVEPEMGEEPVAEDDDFDADDMGGQEADMGADEFEEEPVQEDGEEEFDFATGGAEGEEDIDLDEILREMGYGEEGEEEVEAPSSEEFAEKEAELEEAYKVIRSLKGTINEVNLLNAKLLYSNKLFRNYEMTNEQKMRVIETLDRTNSIREVKLVFATLAESMKFGVAKRKQKSKISESFASKPVASTAPKKQVINESVNAMAERFKKLANIKG